MKILRVTDIMNLRYKSKYMVMNLFDTNAMSNPCRCYSWFKGKFKLTHIYLKKSDNKVKCK